MHSKSYILVISLYAILEYHLSFSQCPEIVSRTQWKAKSSQLTKMSVKPVGHVFIHHTEGPACGTTEQCSNTVRGIQTYHQNTQKWSDIGYNFLIGGDGKVYEGRGWDKVGAHTRGMNDKAIAISFIGSYTNVKPKDSMLNAALKLIECGKKLGYVSSNAEIHGHRDQNCTDCPGNQLYAIIKNWKNFKSGKLSGFVC